MKHILPTMKKIKPTVSRLALLLLGTSMHALAATPDAGGLLRDENARKPAASMQLPVLKEADGSATALIDSEPKLKISRFRISGLTSVPEAEVQQFLAAYNAHSLGFSGLNKMTEQLSVWLRARGLVTARAFVPQQNIRDGVVEIQVLEKPQTLASADASLPEGTLTTKAAVTLAAPDAGSLFRDETLAKPAAPKPAAAVDASAVVGAGGAVKALNDSGPKMRVKSYLITGLTALPEEDAQQFLAAYADKDLGVEGLNSVAERFEQWLREKGLFTARAYVPPQDIKDGKVDLRVLEGRLEGIDVKRTAGTRLSEESLAQTLAQALPVGAPLEQELLERGLLLANDLPAISARAVLVPGNELGGARVLIEAAQGPVLTGTVDLDNGGNRYTGEWRAGASIAINDPLGRGDQWTLRASGSEGSSLLRAGYVTPFGTEGWKAGVNLIDSRYKLCCVAEAGALDSEGGATAVSVFASYPLIRSRMNNLTLSTSAAQRAFNNRAGGVSTSDKKSDSFSLGFNGDRSDVQGLVGLGGYTTYSALMTSGKVLADVLPGDQSQGSFDKWGLQVAHLMRVSKQSAVYGSVSAQWAGKNLDSSEKFVLGGQQGIRAYPTGEAAGDSGWLVNLEYRHELNNQWGVVGFVDYGSVQQRHSVFDGWNSANPSMVNNYDLAGAGASLAWSPAQGRQVTLTLANRIGDNPGRSATGNDSDGKADSARLWLQSSFAF